MKNTTKTGKGRKVKKVKAWALVSKRNSLGFDYDNRGEIYKTRNEAEYQNNLFLEGTFKIVPITITYSLT